MRHLDAFKAHGTLGFVPTMGALHDGHMSLIELSKKHCERTICSIFVNPTQFNEESDLVNYPKPLERDLQMLKERECDVVFIPSVSTIYPKDQVSDLNIVLGDLGNTLEAAHREGHFEGVMQVVNIFLEIVHPDVLFLGQKDYQQLMIIKKMIQQLKVPTKVYPCPIVREEDGLAMSSRNVRLSTAQRVSAVKLSQTLFSLQRAFSAGKNWQPSKAKAIKTLNADQNIEVEYLELASSSKLEIIKDWNVVGEKRLLIAANLGEIRLIDNISL